MGSWLANTLKIELKPSTEPFIHEMIMWSAVAYGALVAIPFVPGIEIAIGLFMVAGPGITPLLYGVTIAGLVITFTIGYLVPLSKVRAVFEFLRMRRASRLIQRLDGLSSAEQLDLLRSSATARIFPWLLNNRYLALAVLLNLPGNIVIGGGGGIVLVAGLSKLFTPAKFFLTLVLAVAPIPAALLLFGPDILIIK